MPNDEIRKYRWFFEDGTDVCTITVSKDGAFLSDICSDPTYILPFRREGISYNNFQKFLEGRCPPKTRANIDEILRDLGLTKYSVDDILEKTQGQTTEDHYRLVRI